MTCMKGELDGFFFVLWSFPDCSHKHEMNAICILTEGCAACLYACTIPKGRDSASNLKLPRDVRSKGL